MLPYAPHPVLLDLGFLKIYSWGFMVAIAFIAATILAAKEAKRKKIDHEKIYSLVTYIIIGAIIGSRVGYLLFNPSNLTNFLDIFRFWEGGLSFHGGFIGGILFGLFYVKKNKLNFWKIADVIAPSIPLAHAIGRIGCFLRGCCYGIETTLPWGIKYLGEVRHPTQIYSSIALFLIFIFLSKQKYKKGFNGALFLTYIMVYSTFRFLIEFIRVEQKVLFGLTGAQLVSIVLFVIAIFIFLRFKKKNV
ncbi:MAG: prolipoprotein diacylglyceryl transferase [Nanoarchaeota archaeon]|nr:prolipoprotein diacylglyceryl transferase [Nanoarchaeota archaeon]